MSGGGGGGGGGGDIRGGTQSNSSSVEGTSNRDNTTQVDSTGAAGRLITWKIC